MKKNVEGKEIVYSSKARQKVLDGINVIADAIKVTLGPRGKTVLIEKELSYPHLTKDGVTVARNIRLSDSGNNMGIELIRNVAAQTGHKVGDGTTTSTVLAQEIATEGIKLITAGMNSTEIRKGMIEAKDFVVKHISEHAIPVETRHDLWRVAYISSNSDSKIADILADAFERVGRDGIIVIEDGNSNHLEIKFTEGIEFESGYQSPLFINKIEKSVVEHENVLVMIHEKPILNLQPYLNLFIEIKKTGMPLLIIAENIDHSALSMLGANAIQQTKYNMGQAAEQGLSVVAVKNPCDAAKAKTFNEDVALFVGGSVVSQDLGFTPEKLPLTILGKAEKVIVKLDKTTIVGGDAKNDPLKKSKLDGHINALKEKIDDEYDESDKEFLKYRYGQLTRGIATIRVGGASLLESRETKDRVDDAYHATKAAYKKGVVPGGGIALLRAGRALATYIANYPDSNVKNDYLLGMQLVLKACRKPLWQILLNTGIEDANSVITNIINNEKYAYGYDAKEDTYVDMLSADIVDPAEVVICALEDAVSACSALITLEAMVLYEEEKDVK